MGCTAGVKSWENLEETRGTNGDDKSDCHKTFDNADKYKVDVVNDKKFSHLEKNEFDSRLRHLESSTNHNEKSHNVIDSTILNDDQSELLLLEQDREPLVEEVNSPSEKYCEKTVEDTYNCQQESIQKVKGEMQDDLGIHKHSEVKLDCSKDTNDCDERTKDNIEYEANAEDFRSRDKTMANGNAGRRTERDELDPELENVPLREILLKLKVSCSFLFFITTCHFALSLKINFTFYYSGFSYIPITQFISFHIITVCCVFTIVLPQLSEMLFSVL